MKKYFVAFTMIFVLILSLSAFATEEEFCATSVADKLPSYMPDVSDDADLFAETVDIRDYLYENMMNFEAKIDITSYGIKKENISDLDGYVGDALLMNYELYYVDFYYTYWYNTKGVVTRIAPNYLVTDKTEIENTIAQMDEVYAKLLSLVDDSMTDLEKIITLYNEIILMTHYDYAFEKVRPKDLLLEGTTVCQGYAAVLYELCKRLDIPCGLVRSVEMNHVWNAFYVDGEWYHADATWDDVQPANSSRMTYTYFLKSNDYYLNSADHYDFTPLESESTKFDNYFWNDATSKLVILADHIFFIKGKRSRGTICVFNPETQTVTELYKFTAKWYDSDAINSYWAATHSGLEFDNGRLFFNTNTSIMSCKLDGTDAREEFVTSVTTADSVYGCYKKDGKLSYSVGPRSSPTTDQTQYLIDFPESTQKPFYVVNTFKMNGKNYLSFVNDTDETINVFSIFKNANKFDHVEIVPITESEGKVELPSSDTEYEYVIINSAFSPLAEKKSIQP